MKLFTLGTSHGVSESDRFCTSAVIETGGAYYVFDVGAPVDRLFAQNGWKMTDIRGIFLTHMHNDHVGALPFLIKDLEGGSLTKYIKRREGVEELSPVTVLFPETAGRECFLQWMKCLHSSVDLSDPAHPFLSKSLTLQSLEERVDYADEQVQVYAVRTDHLKEGSYAYVLSAEGRRVLITGDLSHDFHDFPEIAQAEHFDLIVCEFTHFKPDAALPILQTCKTDRLVFSHICDPRGERAAWLEANREAFPYPVSLACDGAVFAL